MSIRAFDKHSSAAKEFLPIWQRSVLTYALNNSEPAFDLSTLNLPQDPGPFVPPAPLAVAGNNAAQTSIEVENHRQLFRTAEMTYLRDQNIAAKCLKATKDFKQALVDSLSAVEITIAPQGFALLTITEILTSVTNYYGVIYRVDEDEIEQHLLNIKPGVTIEEYIGRLTSTTHVLYQPEQAKMRAIESAIRHQPESKIALMDYRKLVPDTTLQTAAGFLQYLLSQMGNLGITSTVSYAEHKKPAAAQTSKAAAAVNGRRATTPPKRRKPLLIAQMLTVASTGAPLPNPQHPAGAPPNYCFCHGWNNSHPGKDCSAMATDPLATPEMKSSTKPCILPDAANTMYLGSTRVTY